MGLDPTHAATLLELAEDTRLNLGRWILSYLKHELSQPLGAILLTTEACAMGLRTGRMDVTQVASDLEEVNRSAVEASKLLADVRDLAGVVTPEYVVANANTTLARLLEAMSADLDRAGIQTRIDLEPKLPVFRFDPRLLALAVSELVRNAEDALPSGGELHVRSAVQDPKTATITVADNGPGVGDLTIDKLTAPFFTTRKGHLGMGLTLCKTCVDVQGGKLTLDHGAEEQGSSFVIHMPSS